MIDLKTERLSFRAWTHDDYPILADFYSKDENARFVGGVKGPETAWRLMATYLGHYNLMGYSYLAVMEQVSGDFIGTVGLWNSLPWPEPELGYWLLPNAQGKGYGVEAGLAVKAYAKTQAKLPTLVSYIDPANAPSKKLALRLGAHYEQTIELLDFGPHEVYRYW